MLAAVDVGLVELVGEAPAAEILRNFGRVGFGLDGSTFWKLFA